MGEYKNYTWLHVKILNIFSLELPSCNPFTSEHLLKVCEPVQSPRNSKDKVTISCKEHSLHLACHYSTSIQVPKIDRIWCLIMRKFKGWEGASRVKDDSKIPILPEQKLYL